MAETPGHILRFRGVLTEADAGRLRRNFQRAIAADPRPKLLDPLPWRVRLRLRLTRRIDHVAIWLADHGHEDAAIRLWRMFRMW